jgi:hypothetical protein
MEEAKKGIRIGGSRLNNLRYSDDTTLTAENIMDLHNLISDSKTEVKAAVEKQVYSQTLKRRRSCQ